MRRHKKTCCVCRQCSKNFEIIKEWKEHNCTNLSDKEAVPQTNQYPVWKQAPRQQVVVPKRQAKRNL